MENHNMNKFYEFEQTRKYIKSLSNLEQENLFNKLNIQLGLPQLSIKEVKEIISETGIYDVLKKIKEVNSHGQRN
jgi:hypothetical protein